MQVKFNCSNTGDPILTTTEPDVSAANVTRKLDGYHSSANKQKEAEDNADPPIESNAYTGDDGHPK